MATKAHATKGSITADDQSFIETWENISASSSDVIRLDRRGDETHELISGRRTFMLTTQDRLISQDRCLDPIHDPFQNGCFRPVIVPDSVDVKSNPNALSDDEISSILVSSELAWDEYMKLIDAASTLQRMVDIADQGELDLSLKRYKALEARLAEVKPKARVVQKDQEQYDSISGSSSASSRRGSKTS